MQIISPQQILLPKKVYIGDTAELRCNFNTPNPVLKELVSGGGAELPLVSQTELSSADFPDQSIFATPHKDYEIQRIILTPAGVDYYQLTITFVPWKTGDLLLPPLEIEGSDLILELKPVQIVSLISTDSANATTLHDSAAPLLLPGTAYKLYGSLAAFIIVLIVLIRLIVKRKSLLFYFNQKRLLRKYKKNKKQTLKLLKKLEAAAADSETSAQASVTAQELQKILRNYLEVRFDYPFTRCVTSELNRGWQAATDGLLSDSKNEAFGDIVSSFIRTDYIRYSKSGRFKTGELRELIEKLSASIETLEGEDLHD